MYNRGSTIFLPAMKTKDVCPSDHEDDDQDGTHSSSPPFPSPVSSSSCSPPSASICESSNESEISSGSGSTNSDVEEEEDNDEEKDLSEHVEDESTEEIESDHDKDDQDGTHSSSPWASLASSNTSDAAETGSDSHSSSASACSGDEEEEENDEETDLSGPEENDEDESTEEHQSDHDKDDQDGTHSPSSASSCNGSAATEKGSGSASSGGEEEEDSDQDESIEGNKTDHDNDDQDGTHSSSSASSCNGSGTPEKGSGSASSGGEEEENSEQDESIEGNKTDHDNDDQDGTHSSSSASSCNGSGTPEKGSGSASSGGEEEEDSDEEVDQSGSESDYTETPDTSTIPTPAAKGDDLAFQLIDGKSNFKDKDVNDFATEVNLYQYGRSYAVVAIMGPQSSGKSTLLNHLFQTKFKEMNEFEGRSQTTQGIWLARCPNIKPLTLVMDIEGTDGSERGEDDTTFERRSALFALAVADVVLVNMWCHDIGREQAASKPLLRVVFQQVLLRFSNKPRKIALMFIVRDKTRTPEQKLEAKLRSDVDKIWASIKKPEESSNAVLSNFFKVEVVFLPNYEERKEDFISKVEELKQRFVNSTAPGGLADSGNGKEPGSGFTISAQNIWKDIMENKDLNLPLNKILVATTRCHQIITELLDNFETNEDWCNLRKEAFNGFLPDFGTRVNSILNNFLSKFDVESSYYDEAVTTGKRKELVDNLLKLVHPVYQAVLNHLRLLHLNKFMEAFAKSSGGNNSFAMVADRSIRDCLIEFDKDFEAVRIYLANWDAVKERVKLRQDMKRYLTAKGEEQVASIIRRLYEPKVKQELSDFVGYLLCEEADPTWSKIRMRLNNVVQSTITKLNKTLSEFSIDDEGRTEKIQNIEEYAKQVVETKAREESGRAGVHMISKFLTLFKADHQWNSEQEIQAAAKAALYTPLDILSGLAAIRLEAGDIDNIHQLLSVAFWGPENPNAINYLVSSSWEQVPPSRTLLTPTQCVRLWKTYICEADKAIKKANEDLEKRRPRWIRFVLGIVTELVYVPLKAIDWVLKMIF